VFDFPITYILGDRKIEHRRAQHYPEAICLQFGLRDLLQIRCTWSPSSMRPPPQFVEQHLQIAVAHRGRIEDPAPPSYLLFQLFIRHRIEQAEDCNDPRTFVPVRLDR